ncbi:uncharacterized protein LOC143846755 [Tasmannia lanceolata]|uniref:uncharacterized protein LOC143846755 n=1 Tax=Tasmannia lanceolata TaxID=3420 RepID=UPI004063A6A6
MGSVGAIILLSVLLLSLISISHSSKKTVPIARKEDIPFIKCQVCQKLATQLYHQLKKKETQISPKKVSEFQIIELAENVCNLKKEEGDWILRIDIVEKGSTLELVDQDTEGQCNSECKTIERACQEVMGYSDTDVAEYLFNAKPQIDSLVNFLCDDLSKACSAKPPPIPKNRIPGEPFIPKSSKDAEMEKILKSMEGIPGAPGMKMYSREDLMNQNFGDEDADEDDEDDDGFPSNLGKVLRDKKSAKADWKQRVVEGIRDTSTEIQKHVKKASQWVQEWWQGEKTSSNPLKGTKTEL